MEESKFKEVVTSYKGREIYPFHDFDKEPHYEGVYLKKFEWIEDDPEKSWTALTFRNLKGETCLLSSSHQIVEAIKAVGKGLYRITFLRKEALKKKGEVRVFKIAVAEVPKECLIWYDEKPEEPKPLPENKSGDDLPF